MDAFNFITVRLGKDSINDINLICSSGVGILSHNFKITVKCTQIPDNYAPDDYAYIWLGSDNNKGAPTKWKQGFKAVGKVTNIIRGANYNDTSETTLEIIYIFRDSINRMDILRCAPNEYYWCSSFPLIGIDDHANQTIRLMSGTELSDIKAFFRALDKTSDYFKEEIIQVQPAFEPYFDVYIPSPKDFPNIKSLSDIKRGKNMIRDSYGPLQQIFFGAPGTGKSFEINRITKGKKVIRTTFHPDSDYSTFVGAYKPTSLEVPVRDVTGKIIIENGQKVTENRIVYEFVEQAFLQAYTKAWIAYAEKADGEKPEEQYLVIEEINRGNCAQIFGDLFQLLDRNGYGFSDYPITADKDMKKQLAKAFEKKTIDDAERINSIYGKDIVSQVLSGDILLLPDNLYIWATMNTSDQSLFPIDSAFKRRWDWKYMPICEGKENGLKLDWKIKVKDNLYDWWQFVEKINNEINEQTKSEDKKLGYFFCKAQNGIITAETFVSKVIFYLWNDVFKDQAFASDIFRDGEDELTFNKFYDVDNKGKAIIKEDKVELFLSNLEVEVIGKAGDNSDGEEVIDDTDTDSRRVLHVEFADETIAIKRFPQYLQVLQKIGLDKAEAVASEKQIDVLGCALVTKNREEEIENSQYTYVESEGYYVVKGIKGKVMLDFLPMISDRYNLNLKVEYK